MCKPLSGFKLRIPLVFLNRVTDIKQLVNTVSHSVDVSYVKKQQLQPLITIHNIFSTFALFLLKKDIIDLVSKIVIPFLQSKVKSCKIAITFNRFPPAANIERASKMTSLFDGLHFFASCTNRSSSTEY